MAKVFVQTHTKERFEIVHQFLLDKGYDNDFHWIEPDTFPFGSFPTAIDALIGHAKTGEYPDICIVDLRFREDVNGAEAFDAIDFVLFAAGLLRTSMTKSIKNTKTKYRHLKLKCQSIQKQILITKLL